MPLLWLQSSTYAQGIVCIIMSFLLSRVGNLTRIRQQFLNSAIQPPFAIHWENMQKKNAFVMNKRGRTRFFLIISRD